jgi:hypothetical protein
MFGAARTDQASRESTSRGRLGEIRAKNLRGDHFSMIKLRKSKPIAASAENTTISPVTPEGSRNAANKLSWHLPYALPMK